MDNWQRIEQIIKWTGYASVSAFAREIGLNRSENLYQIKRGNNGISRDLARTITTTFPEISKAWLLTGEGMMLKSDMPQKDKCIPFYGADAVQVAATLDLPEEERPTPDYRISFPTFDGCDFAAVTTSAAMEPDIRRGAILFFQDAASRAIPGETYLVVCPQFSGVRYLRRTPGSGDVRLVPANRKDYDEVVVAEKDIKHLYIVRGVVTGKGI